MNVPAQSDTVAPHPAEESWAEPDPEDGLLSLHAAHRSAAQLEQQFEDQLAAEQRTERLRQQAQHHRGHMRVAHEFAADSQMRLMHVTGLGWFHFDQTHWVSDVGDKVATNAVMRTIRRLAGASLADKELYTDLVRSQTASGARGVLDLAASLEGISVKVSEIDANPYVLNTPAGSLDLENFILRPHNPGDRLTKTTRGSYAPSASPDRWTAFLERILPDPDVRAYLQKVMGVALVGKQLEHILVIATGEGRNGKGVTYETLAYVLGDYAHIAPSTLFEQTRGNANGASPALFDLRGARFVALSETEKTARIASALLKSLTGGDPVTARGLYKNPITFIASWLILLVTNHLPTLPADDPAVWERVRVVPFNVFIPKNQRDSRLASKLEQDADGILTWAVEGLREYWAHGLDAPEAVQVATDDYAAAQDNVTRFIHAICTVSTSGGGDTTKALHDAYTEWAIADGIFREHRLGRTDFGRSLDKLGYPAVKKSRGMVREGLTIEPAGGQVRSYQGAGAGVEDTDSPACAPAETTPWEAPLNSGPTETELPAAAA